MKFRSGWFITLVNGFICDSWTIPFHNPNYYTLFEWGDPPSFLNVLLIPFWAPLA